MLSPLRKIVKLLPQNLRGKLPARIKLIEISSVESRWLNRIYRKKDKPTNVLSFYYNRDYGEILLCPEVIRKEAKSAGNSYKYQFTWMVLHGIIHLAGLHHEGSRKVELKAEHLEKNILSKLKIQKEKGKTTT